MNFAKITDTLSSGGLDLERLLSGQGGMACVLETLWISVLVPTKMAAHQQWEDLAIFDLFHLQGDNCQAAKVVEIGGEIGEIGEPMMAIWRKESRKFIESRAGKKCFQCFQVYGTKMMTGSACGDATKRNRRCP